MKTYTLTLTEEERATALRVLQNEIAPKMRLLQKIGTTKADEELKSEPQPETKNEPAPDTASPT